MILYNDGDWRSYFIRLIGIIHSNLIIQILLFPTEKAAKMCKIESKRKLFLITGFSSLMVSRQKAYHRRE